MKNNSLHIPRPGSILINNIEVPEVAIIHKAQSGKQYYISGTNFVDGSTTIRWIDTGEFETAPASKFQQANKQQCKANKAVWDARPKSKNPSTQKLRNQQPAGALAEIYRR